MNDTRQAPPSRMIELDGALNLRDLGGLSTTTGGVVRRGRIWRGEYPGYVASAQIARDLGLRSVVDLRRGTEAATECVDWAGFGVGYARWPLSAGSESSWRAAYTSYLEHRPETVAGAVREVMAASGEGVLFHCAAGKDRTGVVAALLLRMLGVADADIVEDYVLSAPSVERVLTRLRRTAPYDVMLRDATVDQQLPHPELIESLLAWVDRRGGADAWLIGQGVPDAEIDDFRRRMVA